MLKVIGRHQTFPDPQGTPSVSAVDIDDLVCPEICAVLQAWKKTRGWHGMPSLEAWAQSDFERHASHASIARVVDDGRDYEFEFIGDAHIRAYGVDHQGKRTSEITRLSPRFGRQLKASYDLVRISGHPHAFRGSIGAENSEARFVWFETAYLPLGEGGIVDYILNAAVYRLRADAA